MVVVWFFGLYSLEDGLVLVCHSQHVALPPGGVQAAEKWEKKHIGMQPC